MCSHCLVGMVKETGDHYLCASSLASPLDAEWGDSDALQPGQAEYKGSVLPLICCLLTKFTASELSRLTNKRGGNLCPIVEKLFCILQTL